MPEASETDRLFTPERKLSRRLGVRRRAIAAADRPAGSV